MNDHGETPLAPWERELLNGGKVGFALHISLLMAFDVLKGIVDRFPDHVNVGRCVYAREESGVLTPVCIVGQFFHDLGMLRALLIPREEFGQDTPYGFLVESDPTNASDPDGTCNLSGLDSAIRNFLRDRHGITFDDDAWTFLNKAQGSQDAGLSWSVAFEDAARHTLNTHPMDVPDVRTQAERLNDALNV